MTLADQIRDYVDQHYVRPARAASRREITIRAGDVHSDMGLVSRMPAVCAALASKMLADRSSIRLVDRTGPAQGSNVFFRFSLGADGPLKTDSTSRPEQGARTPPTDPAPAPARTTLEHTPAADTVHLVSCVAAKSSGPTEARSLYVSAWFRKARAYVERTPASAWFILSAEHGLVDPATVIAPYERTLNTMSVRERRAWADRVIEQLKVSLPRARRIVVLAGERYREFLMEHLRSISDDVQVPMEGLGIGEQLSWLSRVHDGQA